MQRKDTRILFFKIVIILQVFFSGVLNLHFFGMCWFLLYILRLSSYLDCLPMW